MLGYDEEGEDLEWTWPLFTLCMKWVGMGPKFFSTGHEQSSLAKHLLKIVSLTHLLNV